MLKKKTSTVNVEMLNLYWNIGKIIMQIQDGEKKHELSEQGHQIKESKDLVKDPFVLEFLDVKENTNYLESDLVMLAIKSESL